MTVTCENAVHFGGNQDELVRRSWLRPNLHPDDLECRSTTRLSRCETRVAETSPARGEGNFFRPAGASASMRLHTHGSRRGLHSIAATRLRERAGGFVGKHEGVAPGYSIARLRSFGTLSDQMNSSAPASEHATSCVNWSQPNSPICRLIRHSVIRHLPLDSSFRHSSFVIRPLIRHSLFATWGN